MQSCSPCSHSWGGKSYAHDIAVANADGVTIYYDYTNNKTKLKVTYQGSSFSSEAYAGKVVIPESVTYEGNAYPVTSIGLYAFRDCSSLTTLYSLNTTPPSVDNTSAFSSYHYMDVDVFVPAEAFEAYQTADVWKEFQKLQAISDGGGSIVAIEKVSATAEQIHSANSQITVTGLTDGTTVAVYDLSGKQVGSAVSKGGQVSISTGMTAGAAAIVKVGERSVKTVMK